jgi:hypothetical protein
MTDRLLLVVPSVSHSRQEDRQTLQERCLASESGILIGDGTVEIRLCSGYRNLYQEDRHWSAKVIQRSLLRAPMTFSVESDEPITYSCMM